ncbi:unnamed protein product, partial [Rotaria sordida]
SITTQSFLASSPKYQNEESQQAINANKNHSYFHWNGKRLYDEGMSLIAYYLL